MTVMVMVRVRVNRARGGLCASAGCALAIFGVVALGFDGGGTAAAAAGAASSGLNVGDIIALFGAASYSLYIFRISTFGRQGLPGNLTQAWKTMILAVLYLGQGRLVYSQNHVYIAYRYTKHPGPIVYSHHV